MYGWLEIAWKYCYRRLVISSFLVCRRGGRHLLAYLLHLPLWTGIGSLRNGNTLP